MTKTIIIEGMNCSHCSNAVAKALNALEGVTAEVNLASKTATVSGAATDEALRLAVEEAGFDVVEIR